MNDGKKIVKDDEIDVIQLIIFFWSRRIFIVKVSIIFFALGVLIALTSKVEYEAYCKLLPESQENGADLGGLSSLAGLAGFNLNLGSGAALNPQLYPQIVKSAPFLNDLISRPIYFEGIDTTVSSYNYFQNLNKRTLADFLLEYSIGLPGKIIKSFSSEENVTFANHSIMRFSKDEWDLIQEYSERLSVAMDTETGVIELRAMMPDPVAAAKVTDLLVKELTSKITNYKLGKAQANLEFIEERFNESKQQYESKQAEVARFTDRNRNISNSFIQTEYERLQNELNILFEVYKGLATQLEQTRIKVKDETPVFTVLEPIRIPEDKSKPKRLLIVIFTTLTGLFISVCYLLIKSRINL